MKIFEKEGRKLCSGYCVLACWHKPEGWGLVTFLLFSSISFRISSDEKKWVPFLQVKKCLQQESLTVCSTMYDKLMHTITLPPSFHNMSNRNLWFISSGQQRDVLTWAEGVGCLCITFFTWTDWNICTEAAAILYQQTCLSLTEGLQAICYLLICFQSLLSSSIHYSHR